MPMRMMSWNKVGLSIDFCIQRAKTITFACLYDALRSIIIISFSIFLVGWGADHGIGGFGDEPGIKSQLMNLVRSVRTVMRGKLSICQYLEIKSMWKHLMVMLILNQLEGV